jgi:20S proteasome subunit alpha 3
VLVRIGRLHQVEYAIEAINNAGTCVGLVGPEGIVLAAEKRVVSKLLAPSKTSEKTYILDNHVVCLVAGLTADANILIQRARVASQRYLYAYQQPMPVEQVVRDVCDYK